MVKDMKSESSVSHSTHLCVSVRFANLPEKTQSQNIKLRVIISFTVMNNPGRVRHRETQRNSGGDKGKDKSFKSFHNTKSKMGMFYVLLF